MTRILAMLMCLALPLAAAGAIVGDIADDDAGKGTAYGMVKF